MVYKLTEELLDNLIYYLVYRLKNTQAAREDLYIHIPSGCTNDFIVRNLDVYIQNTGCKLEYEF